MVNRKCSSVGKVVLFLLFTIMLPESGAGQDLQKQNYGMGDEALVVMLEEVYLTEQQPIRRRDSLMKIHGVESPEVQAAQELYKHNHDINEKKVKDLLDTYGWPEKSVIGEQGNLTICNVLQHSDPEVRVQYLPVMRTAVAENNLHPRFLARAEDRIATDRGELQIYGGQMKYYPETKSFNVWPVYDPENIDKRRAEIGLGPIAEHLMSRFDFEWDLEEQIQRTREFEAAKNSKSRQ